MPYSRVNQVSLYGVICFFIKLILLDIDQLHLIISVRGYLPKHLVETFYKTPEFYSRRLPEPKHVPIERHCPILAGGLWAAKEFIEKCLTMDPDYRPGCAELLQTDYFNDEEFIKRKSILQG